MIIVNSPGSWDAVYAPLAHRPWHGASLADVIFPAFLVIVGISVTLSLGKLRQDSLDSNSVIRRKIVVRAAKIFALGLFLSLWPRFELGELRFAGVLQRIAVAYLVCSLLFLRTSWRFQLVAAFALLGGYWLVFRLVPVPVDPVIEQALTNGFVERSHGQQVPVEVHTIGEEFVSPNAEPGTNWAALIDRKLLPGALYEKTWDPEGLLSTLPAIASGILGLLVGSLVLGKEIPVTRKAAATAIAGAAMLGLGLLWGLDFPINKNLWSSSFVLWSGGISLLALGAVIFVVDHLGWQRWAFPARVLGVNAIASYVFSMILYPLCYASVEGFPSLTELVTSVAVGAGFSEKTGSLLFAILFTAAVFLPVFLLYRRRVFLRL